MNCNSPVADPGNKNQSEGSTQDLVGARIVTTMFVNDQPQTAVEIIEVRSTEELRIEDGDFFFLFSAGSDGAP